MTYSNFDVRTNARFILPADRRAFLRELEDKVKARRVAKRGRKKRTGS